MNSNRRLLISVLLALASLFPGSLGAQFAPDGWIQGHAWKVLGPLGNPLGCDGGGPDSMREAWLAPHELASEDPLVRETWDIDFASSHGSSWRGQVVGETPVWVSDASLEEDFGGIPGAVPSPLRGNDILDMAALVGHYNNVIIPALGSETFLPLALSDDAYYAAITYVRNTTSDWLPVEICTSSDDAMQLWLNDQRLAEYSVCRPTAPGCDDRTATWLPPGVSRIAVIVWQGGFGWSHRLRLEHQGIPLVDDGGPVQFLGSDDPALRGQTANAIQRLANADAFGCGPVAGTGQTLRVVLRAAPQNATVAEETVRLVEHIERTDGGVSTLMISNVSAAGTVEPLIEPESGEVTGARITWELAWEEFLDGVTYEVESLQPGAYRATAGGAGLYLWFEEAVDGSGLRGGSALTFSARGVGIWERAAAIGEPEDIGEVSFDGLTYTQAGQGADIWADGDQFHFAYTPVTGDFELSLRILSTALPTGSTRWGKYGPMARYTCAPDSAYHFLQYHLASLDQPYDPPRHGQRRIHGDAASVWDPSILDVAPGSLSPPSWMRIVRRGNAVYSFVSRDDGGQPALWRFVGVSVDPAMPDTLLAGMAVLSHNATRATIRYDRVTLRSLDPLDDLPSCRGGSSIASSDFELANGSAPPGSNVVGTGEFAPSIQGGRLRLADRDRDFAASAVWFPLAGAIEDRGGLRFEFDAFVSPRADFVGDGFTFAVLEVGSNGGSDGLVLPSIDLDTLVGDPGGSLGFEGGALGWRTEDRHGFAVEADTWTGGGLNEASGSSCEGCEGGWHTGINPTGQVTSLVTNEEFGVAELPDLFAATGIHFRVDYFAEGRVDLYLRDNSGTYPETLIASATIPALEGALVFGFTAGTGLATLTAEVDNLEVRELDCTECPIPEISGATQAEPGSLEQLEVAWRGTLPVPIPRPESARYRWEVVSGPARIEGSVDDPVADLRFLASGDVVVRSQVDGVDGCEPVELDHAITVACPLDGDSACQGLSASGPEGGGPGTYVFSARGEDASGDPLRYSFVVTRNGLIDRIFEPQLDPNLALELDAASWRIRVAVDDNLACDDTVAPGAHCTLELDVHGSVQLQLPGDCNQDGRLDISDTICVFGHLFLGNPSDLPCDAPESDVRLLDFNGDRRLDLSDGVAMLSALFLVADSHVLGDSCTPIALCPRNPARQ